MDHISKLPPSIIENIICLVPIQEAARTSIFSKEWRYHWTKIPKLVFDEDDFQASSYTDEPSALEETFNNIQSQRKGMTTRCKLFYAIYQVLLKHEGLIHKFTLSMQTDKTCVEIDHIVSYLSRNTTVKKLTLDLAGECRLPVSLFLFNHLTDLYLISCELDLQPTCNGLYSLTHLFIELVTITKSTLLHFLSNCPLLKSLTLNSDDVQGIDEFTITNLFECFPMVENLVTLLLAIRCFAQRGVPHVLPTALIHLKYVYIDHMSFLDKYGLPFLLFLIRSSPNLEKLKLQIFDHPWLVEPQKCPSTLKDYSDMWLEHLNVLEIFNLSNEKLELHFMKLILAKSPMLKKVRIVLWEDVDKDEELLITGFLLSSQRASPVVDFVVGKGI